MIQMVTDRTESDVMQGNEKGVYSYTDLNRVESAVEELFELANDMGFHFTTEVKTDWAAPGDFSKYTWPTSGQMQRYIQNVHGLCDAFFVQNKNLPSSMSDLTWKGANAIEESLELAYTRIQNIISIYRYSGEIYAGEETGL